MKSITLIILIIFCGFIVSPSEPKYVQRRGNFNRFDDYRPSSSNAIRRYESSESSLGYDFDWIFEWINRMCKDAANVGDITPPVLPEAKNLRFLLLKSRTENYTIPLEHSEDLWVHPNFDRNLKTVIMINGWLTNYNSSSDDRASLYAVADAYFCRNDKNFVVLDPQSYLDIFYPWAAYNTHVLGKLFAKALIDLDRSKAYPIENIHLIGHSLGSHIAGYIGKYFKESTGNLLPQITALDPANPCFNPGTLMTGLQKGDAIFIDVTHTDPGQLGQYDPLGDVDFFPNGYNEQPGCDSITCAHARSWRYYSESVYIPNADGFMATKCSSMDELKSGNCNGSKYPMGYATPDNIDGYFLLTTNAASPFGKNSVDPSQITCNASR